MTIKECVAILRRVLVIGAVFVSFSVQSEAFKLRSSDVATNFHVLDQVSNSLPAFFTLKSYQEALGSKFSDQERLSKYRALRKKYQNVPAAFSDHKKEKAVVLFPPNPEQIKDPIADAFFTSQTVEEALEKLKNVLNAEEIRFLADIFEFYSEVFWGIKEENKEGIQHNLKILNETIPQDEVMRHFDGVRHFYQAPYRTFKSVLLLWCPDSAGFSGNAYGDHLLIRTSNKKITRTDIAKMLVSVIVHEVTHHISSCATEGQKQKLSQAFLTDVKEEGVVSLPHPLFVLEEPLVMATQMVFVKESYPDVYAANQDWFNHPFAIKIFPLLKDSLSQKKVIDLAFIAQCAALYNDFMQEKNRGAKNV